MAGSSFGTIFTISTWGESHGRALGVVVDGCPAGLALSEEDVQLWLNRRKPGQSRYTTPRKEADAVEILSGVFEGRTTGTPISMAIFNTDQRSRDYGQLADCYRPGHADYTFDMKYGFRDYRGGGRSSGRETIGRVAAGAVAGKLLAELGISVFAYSRSIGPVTIDPDRFAPGLRDENPLCMPDAAAAEAAAAYLDECLREKNSAGGVIECRVEGLPPGLGDPVFEKLDANLAKAILSIGAVKGFEIGDGFAAASSTGRENNDAFIPVGGDGTTKAPGIGKRTNHSGGTLGGISDGSTLIFRAAVKPTPSIASLQDTTDRGGRPVKLSIPGRHDPIIVPRAVVVVEAMTALTLADALLLNMGSRLDRVLDFYKNS